MGSGWRPACSPEELPGARQRPPARTPGGGDRPGEGAKTPTVSWRPQETMFVSAQLLLKVSIFLSSTSEITHKGTSPWLNLTDPSWQESLENIISRASSP